MPGWDAADRLDGSGACQCSSIQIRDGTVFHGFGSELSVVPHFLRSTAHPSSSLYTTLTESQ